MKGSVQPLWWISVVYLLCSMAEAAKKVPVRGLPVGTTASAEYGAFLKQARFAPSVHQQNTVENLFVQLQERRITIKPSLYKLLALADSGQLVPLCKKTAVFFSHVDNTRVKNTGCLSSMIRRKKHICDFIAQEDAGIATLTASPWLLSITGMCSGKGCPQGDVVRNLFSWPCWQVNDQFSSELLRSLSSMFHGKGLPKEEDVTTILAWPAWQVDGQFSYDLFRSFSGMFSAKGCQKSRMSQRFCRGRSGR